MRPFATLVRPLRLALVLVFAASACVELPLEGADDSGEPVGTIAGPFTPVVGGGKEDSASVAAIAAELAYYSTQVWEIRNQWEDRATVEAKQAGLAWAAGSNLNWDEKYAAWVKGLRRVRSAAGWYDTFELTAPYGKTVSAPALECAETAMFLRVVFASWYGLPFYLESIDSAGRRVFLGHFGWRTTAGRYGTSPLFKTAYKDYTGRNLARDGWPKDAALRLRGLDGATNDEQPFIAADAHFGAYVDELFLNKRVGHFLIYLLDNYGSMHLATSTNTYNLKPEALRAGDVLVERWQRSGIGHTLVVKQVEALPDGKLAADLASGSMPRRQPKWEEAVPAKSYFTSQYTGGSALASDGASYASYGGGIKRFRVTKKVAGMWQNGLMTADLPNWINSTNLTALGARPARFQSLLGSPDPTALRDALLRGIEDRRATLAHNPAACNPRMQREDLFRSLYTVLQTSFGMSRSEVDRQYRKLEDYVFAELTYSKSKTCCWNSTDANMYQIVMDYSASLQQPGSCSEPPVFKAQGGAYAAYKAYAAQTGRAAQWKDWTEDESCPQRTSIDDVEPAHDAQAYCIVQGGGAASCADDRLAGNQSLETAAVTAAGHYADLRICNGKSDYFKVSVPAGHSVVVSASFTHASGDLDLRVTDAGGVQVAQSEGTGSTETVTLNTAGDFYVRVFGFGTAQNAYALDVVLQ